MGNVTCGSVGEGASCGEEPEGDRDGSILDPVFGCNGELDADAEVDNNVIRAGET